MNVQRQAFIFFNSNEAFSVVGENNNGAAFCPNRLEVLQGMSAENLLCKKLKI